jgi:hypothetical protein
VIEVEAKVPAVHSIYSYLIMIERKMRNCAGTFSSSVEQNKHRSTMTTNCCTTTAGCQIGLDNPDPLARPQVQGN